MIRYFLVFTLLAASATIAHSQQEGPTPTQAVIQVDSKPPVNALPKDITLKVDGHVTPLTSLTPITPNVAQVALLIDDGLRLSVGREMADLRKFVQNLRPGTEIFIGYMQNGRVVPAQNFTTDHAAAARSLRLPQGLPGISASPYFCLSDFVKKWPSVAETQVDLQRPEHQARKARFVLMITNGVDPYNGSTSISNQNSPYVESAIRDAQRAGVPVYSIYFAGAGFQASRGSFSGQSYLQQVAEATGGTAFYQGSGSPVSLDPYIKQFRNAVAESYVATFPAPGSKDLVNISVRPNVPSMRLRAPEQVRPGNQLSTQTN